VTNLLIRFALMVLGVPALTTHSAAQEPRTVTVYAAASLTEAFRDLGKTLEQRHPGLKLRFNFAGSQQLATQLEQGAPADVFASADQRWMGYAKEKGLVEGESPVFAGNRLVVIVPASNPARIQRLEDLSSRGTKVVLAAEAVPAGKYSRQALAKLAQAPGFPSDYDRRVLANVVSQEENVKNVVAKVQLDEADAAVVYRSDVTPPVSRQVRVLDIPDQFNVIASYPIAVLKSARNASAGQQFIGLLLSNDGQQLLRRHGLLPAAVTASVAHP
jgi:molybdate transport system substrate-binding protein